MESVQSTQGGPEFHYTSIKCRSSSHAKKTETIEIGKTTRGSNKGGSEKIKAGEGHQGGVFPRVVIHTMVVKKKIGKWRVFVDFTDLN